MSDQAQQAHRRLPGRADLETAETEVLKTVGPAKAELYTIDFGEGRLVIKDFARRAWWVRWIGRFQISRECRAYAWLGELPGIARLIGRIDRHALALEWVDGERLAWSERIRRGEGPDLLARLREVVDRMHGAGLVHLDLRGRDNVMLTGDDRVVVLDLASAVWFRPGSLAHRILFRWFRVTDDAALLKWKRLLKAGPYSPEEQAFLRRYEFWRSLWVFNRKKKS